MKFKPFPTDGPDCVPMPDFTAFYRAVNGRDPFPWQERLACHIRKTEEWPDEVGVPTGLGKTSCLDIAVWWLASQADREPSRRSAPTRIWWVVNRRLLVDATTEHAEKIARVLGNPSAEVIKAVAERLRSLASDPTGAPLEVIRLRGGVESRAPSDPSRPAVVLSTLPMYGSRLLFRGYGSSRNMRPMDAAMAGTDSLVLLDEAHLAPHLRTLVSALEECAPAEQAILGARRSRPRVVSLTATGNTAESSRFVLDSSDDADPEVCRRLDAAKPVCVSTVQDVKRRDVGKLLAEEMIGLLRHAPGPASGLLFANTPDTARTAFDELRKRMQSDAEVLLLTGRSRERESSATRMRILDGMASGCVSADGLERHLIVVATQTLEVGADIDSEYLVTENCGVRSLTQRLGRLNRLGRHAHARAIYLHAPPPKRHRESQKGSSKPNDDGWPVYGTEPKTVLLRLQNALANDPGESVNLSPRRIADILGEPNDDPGRAPQLLDELLREWIKTTTPPPGEAPVEPYFAGISGGDSSVSVIWRTHVPAKGNLLWPRARDLEAVDIPVQEVREALGEKKTVHRIGSDGVTMEGAGRRDLQPGNTVVLSADRGLLDEFGWNPSYSGPVVDVSLAGNGLPLEGLAIRRLCGIEIPEDLIEKVLGDTDDSEETDTEERQEAVQSILALVRRSDTPPGWMPEEWQAFTASLSGEIREARLEVARLVAIGTEERWWAQSDELDEMSLTDAPAPVDLDGHGRAVATRARAMADSLGIDADVAGAVERAGRLHDIGKADLRFQRWLDPEDHHPGVVLAKSDMPPHRWNADRAASGWPRGARHEALSARLVQRWLDDDAWGDPPMRDVLLHLIISHHGKGRPLVPPVEDGTSTVVSAFIDGISVEVSADLSEVDWNQPARFRLLNDHFGPWGLALLETIVRRADHAESRSEKGRKMRVC